MYHFLQLLASLKVAAKNTRKGNGNPLQCSCLENSVDGGAWWAAVHGVAQNWTQLKWLSMHACIGEGNGSPLQCSCLENPVDGEAWWAAVHGVAQSQTWLKWLSSSSSSEVRGLPTMWELLLTIKTAFERHRTCSTSFFFLMWTIFKVFVWMCCYTVSVLCFGVLANRHVGS